MQGGWGRAAQRAWRLFVMAASAVGAAACVTTSQPVTLDQAGAVAIAFESIDGPPGPQIESLLNDLTGEARAHGLVVLAHSERAHYFVRGYLAAHPEGRATAISWAWDVYDSNRRRAFRLTGVERAAGGGSWRAVDDVTLRRIARDSIERLTAFIASARFTTPAPALTVGS